MSFLAGIGSGRSDGHGKIFPVQGMLTLRSGLRFKNG